MGMLMTALLIVHQSAPYASAQGTEAGEMPSVAATEPTGESVDLLVGDIFEIIPSHTLPDPTYTWILTQDRNFIEAGRAQVFRKRIIQPGTYTLYAEVSSAAQGIHLSETFILDYKARQPGQTISNPSDVTGTSIVATIPALSQNGNVVLPQATSLLKLQPTDPTVKPLALDLNTAIDADGDGNPANDIQSELTFFQSDATPLFVWFASPEVSQNLSVTAIRAEGAQVQEIEVLQQQYAQDQGMTDSTVGVNIEQTGNRTYAFSAELDETISAGTPVLYNWDFGDGQQSLLKNPTHEYAEEGSYDVTLLIRNLTNGQEIATYEEELDVENSAVVSSEPSQTSSEPSEQEPNAPSSSTSKIPWGTILLLGGVFLGSILAGVLIIFLIARLRRKGVSVSSALEKMEETIVKKDDTKNIPTLTIAPPPTPTMSTPPAAVAEREKERTAAPAAPKSEPKIEEKNAPTWLKSGLTNAPAPAPATPAAPRPTPPAPAPTPVPPPAPKPQPVTPPPVAAPPAPPKQTPAPAAQPTPAGTPPWLKQTAPAPVATNAPAPPQPTPPAKPAAQPTPPAPVAAVPTPTPPAPQTPVVPQKPVEPPVPVAPPPAPKPATPPAPVATTPPPAPSAPAQTQPKPASPTPVPPPATPAEKPADAPVAFIRADSLNPAPVPPKPEEKKDNTQQQNG